MMTMGQYQALCAVADTLHFGKAAERLGIAQPQLSELVRRAEQRAEVRIFERRPSVRLTPGGEVLVRAARTILRQATEAVEEARAVTTGHVGKVRLGFSAAAMLTDLAKCVGEFRRANPRVNLLLTEAPSAQLWEGLDRGDLDLIVGREAPGHERHAGEPVLYDELVVLGSDRHPALAADRVRLRDLQGQPFILFSRATAPAYHDHLLSGCAKAGLRPNVGWEVDSWVAILALVAGGHGLTLGTRQLTRLQLPGLTSRPLSERIATDFWLCWRRDSLAAAPERLQKFLLANLTHPGGDAPATG